MRSALLRRSAAAAQVRVMRASTAASAVSLAPDPRSQCERDTDETYAKMRDVSSECCAYSCIYTAVCSVCAVYIRCTELYGCMQIVSSST